MTSSADERDAIRAYREEEYLWGWDPTPGIVSVWADADGRVTVWRRSLETGALIREDIRFRPWILLDRLDDLRHLGARLVPSGPHIPPASSIADGCITWRELRGDGGQRARVVR